ncbi:alpha/beta hydrolase-fold protein [Kribbella sp.]|uniref:alpha/beta hydrolase-fold protein n=1 Tax=Kribbella sp. TaxID=1871183 RepID=UPI002D595A4F|nr:alpha/beta hydrolase-fold protein [Kribbella sp.]HZX03115.1 alpha/beta hydrolase-fold protein [Kribbella sp.]
MDDRTGEFVTETFAYDGGRQVTVYVPPTTPEAVVYAGDGQLLAKWGADLVDADVPPTMVVGVHRTDDPDEMVRIREYSPSFDEAQFAAHEVLFVDDVRRWVGTRFGVALPPERTAVFGVSASAELALAMGMRHPDIYGSVLAASPAADTARPRRCRPHSRARTSSPARTSRSSARTRPAGTTPCTPPTPTYS